MYALIAIVHTYMVLLFSSEYQRCIDRSSSSSPSSSPEENSLSEQDGEYKSEDGGEVLHEYASLCNFSCSFCKILQFNDSLSSRCTVLKVRVIELCLMSNRNS